MGREGNRRERDRELKAQIQRVCENEWGPCLGKQDSKEAWSWL